MCNPRRLTESQMILVTFDLQALSREVNQPAYGCSSLLLCTHYSLHARDHSSPCFLQLQCIDEQSLMHEHLTAFRRMFRAAGRFIIIISTIIPCSSQLTRLTRTMLVFSRWLGLPPPPLSSQAFSYLPWCYPFILYRTDCQSSSLSPKQLSLPRCQQYSSRA